MGYYGNEEKILGTLRRNLYSIQDDLKKYLDSYKLDSEKYKLDPNLFISYKNPYLEGSLPDFKYNALLYNVLEISFNAYCLTEDLEETRNNLEKFKLFEELNIICDGFLGTLQSYFKKYTIKLDEYSREIHKTNYKNNISQIIFTLKKSIKMDYSNIKDSKVSRIIDKKQNDEALLEELASYLNDYYEKDSLEIVVEYDEGYPVVSCFNYLSREEQISLEEVSESWLKKRFEEDRDIMISTDNHCFSLYLQ